METSVITVRRDKPRNFKESDEALFSDVLVSEITYGQSLLLRFAGVLKEYVFNRSTFRFVNDYTHVMPVSHISQYKKLYMYFLPGKHVGKAIWITHEWTAAYFHWLADALTRLIAVEELKDTHVVLLPERYRSLHMWRRRSGCLVSDGSTTIRERSYG